MKLESIRKQLPVTPFERLVLIACDHVNIKRSVIASPNSDRAEKHAANPKIVIWERVANENPMPAGLEGTQRTFPYIREM